MRIRISKDNTEIIDDLARRFNFKYDSVVARIAYVLSLQVGKKFTGEEQTLPSDGREWRDERGLFGVSSEDVSHFVIYRTFLDQHYGRNFTEEEFVKYFRLHLDFGLRKMQSDLNEKSIASGYHIEYLMKIVRGGLDVVAGVNPFAQAIDEQTIIPACEQLVELVLGTDESGAEVRLRINDLNEFDSCNIAVAGMAGSGKTELVKDLLYQISTQSNGDLKFIFFDYKGEGSSERLKPFLEKTNCTMVDLKESPMPLNPLSFINTSAKRRQEFNIKSFVDFVCTIATQLGVRQKNLLQTIITECYEQQSKIADLVEDGSGKRHPTLDDVRIALEANYEANGNENDSLMAIVQDLAKSIFISDSNNDSKIYSRSLYVNLPLELSDTLRQLCVFLTLKYLLAEFSSTNDTEPSEDRIKPLRYVIVVDEAHVYLKNKNASKALEDILRVMRSKGVLVIMLTQGVEDYKTKNFDFVSQIKIPICLNINNKDYRLIESYVGTPKSKQRLLEAIAKLSPQRGLINLTEPRIIRINQFYNRELK